MSRLDFPVTAATVTAALADGLAMLLDDWLYGLELQDDALLDWLAPRIVARARLTARAALTTDSLP